MVELIKVIVMGIVQGLSEFLPISSSAHLVFTSNFIQTVMHSPAPHNSSYDIVLSMMLHLGTLGAVFLFFKQDIFDIWNSLINSVKTKDFTDYNSKTGIYIIAGTIITAAVAIMLGDIAEKLVYSPVITALLLMITGFVLYCAEKYSELINLKLQVITLKTSIIMSIAQGIAALPGFSRSGWTIAAGMFSKTDRIACARYSFLLSIPIILGASVIYPIKEINMDELLSYNWGYILIGTAVSAVSGYICIKFFLEFLSKYSLKVFAYYCFIMGLISGLFFYLFN